jgi:acyl transferase domain-containing protein/acyl carrier protein
MDITTGTVRSHEQIAIIGMACRFPGGANSPELFWQLLTTGVDAIGEIPADRFDIDTYYDPTPAVPGKVAARRGGFLDQVDRFDATFFGISPREAERMDPQQRLLLESSWEALEGAGQIPARLLGSQTGVFVGLWLNDYESRLFHDPDRVDFYMTTGSGRYSASGRLSYFFGFQGPSLTIDTACSSSLVAIHQAVQSLRSGECNLAIAGGANVILQPQITIAYSQSRMMAPDGRCKFGDASANGYVRSEGCGVIVLKRLSDALADRDPIHAVILGSAVNNDGRSSGFLATPGQAGQEDVLRKAYRDADVSPGCVQYVEAHGTGTSAGDPVEINALAAVLSSDRPADRPCHIGSVKTNIGHTEGAAGIAGLIKVVLSLKHKMIPASLHVRELNSNIAWATLPIELQRELSPWPKHEGPALAGVSAFGIAGTNAHVVLQESPLLTASTVADESAVYLLPLSAHTPEALRELSHAYQTFLKSTPSTLHDICYTASVRRAHHDHRSAIIGNSYEDLVERLANIERNETRSSWVAQSAPSKIAFIFPGQGSQWVGMGRQLLEREPVFHAALERFAVALRPLVDWSLIEQLLADDAHSRFDEIDVIQPVLCAIEIALAEVWRAWGIEPAVVIGHSMGEIAAACIAGAIDYDDAARIICLRSRLMKRASGRGAMAVVELSIEQARSAIQSYEDRLSIAVSNSPRSTVVSGDPTALTDVVTALQQRDIFCRWVKVDVAAHSPHMNALRYELVDALGDLRPQETAIPIYSTVTGQLIDGAQLDSAYWGRNLREPVLFADVVQCAIADGLTTFIEMSPHPILLPAIEQCGEAFEALTMVPSLRRDEDDRAQLLRGLGKLYETGHEIEWQRIYPIGHCVSLPSYPWQRERFWYDPPISSAHVRAGTGFDPLLGICTTPALQPGTKWWTLDLNLDDLPYLADHRVRGAVVLPAALYLTMVLSAAREAFGPESIMRDVVFKEAVLLTEDQAVTLQLVIMLDKPGTAAFQILSRPSGSDSSAWTTNVSGLLQLDVSEPLTPVSIDVIEARCQHSQSADEHYHVMRTRGLEYGPSFQGVTHIQRDEMEALGNVQLSQTLQAQANAHRLHPALLDACFQVLVAAEDAHPHDPYLPIGLDRLSVLGDIPTTARAYAIRRAMGDTLEGDVFLLADSGEVVAAAHGLRLERLRPASALNLDRLFYAVQWLPAEQVSVPSIVSSDAGQWLIFADAAGVADSLEPELSNRGAACVRVTAGDAYRRLAPNRFQLNLERPADFKQLLSDLALDQSKPWLGILYLWGVDEASVSAANQMACVGALHLVQAVTQVEWLQAPRLWLVMRGTQAIGSDRAINLAQAPLWGLSGVIAREHPDLRCTRIDLSAEYSSVEIESLRQELLLNGRDDQIALRGTDRYVARLAQSIPERRAGSLSHGLPAAESPAAFQVKIAQPGILDRLELYAAVRLAPRPGQVEIEVAVTGLNFMNVMSAMGIYPGHPNGVGPLGIECAGTIAAVGEGVDQLRVGDRVLAIAFDSLGTYARTDARLVQPIPESLSFEEAASIPIAFVTAYQALCHMARLERGERVLIHAATGGVGLAAIQVARWLGAEIFATAGSLEKRAYLQSLGVQRVMDSRSLSFADEVLTLTNGQGVDVVLNSLSGEAIAKSLSILAPYGRFVEIGKRDIYQNTQIGLRPFQNNLAYFALDLERMVRERPAQVGAVLRDVLQLMETSVFTSLPVRVFPVAQVADAFRLMAQAKHVGKLVIDVKDVAGAEVRSVHPDQLVRPDGTYLITGGLGGLGLKVAQRLAQAGARHLVLTGRSDRTLLPPQTIEAVNALERSGVQVLIIRADVAREDQMMAAFDHIDQTLPPLRGIVHAAGVLDDGVLLQQTAQRFQAVMSPKIDGAWNLHCLTRDRALDFFVMFSSVASLLGTAGQGNYAAANAFLDGLAHWRRAQGLPAVSINWGPWAEVGLAARRGAVGLQSVRGLEALNVEQGLAAFERLLLSEAVQSAVMPLDVSEWCTAHPVDAQSTLFADLLKDAAQSVVSSDRAPATSTSIRQALLAVDPGRRRRSILETYIQEQAAQVLRLSPSRIDLHKPLRTLGFDSLMTLEFRNRLEQGLGLSLSATLVWNYPTVNDLVPYLAAKMNIVLDAALRVAGPVPKTDAAPSPEPDQLSSEEIAALLANELASVDQLLKDFPAGN